jgi:hypothetical protein
MPGFIRQPTIHHGRAITRKNKKFSLGLYCYQGRSTFANGIEFRWHARVQRFEKGRRRFAGQTKA